MEIKFLVRYDKMAIDSEHSISMRFFCGNAEIKSLLLFFYYHDHDHDHHHYHHRHHHHHHYYCEGELINTTRAWDKEKF